MAAGDYEILEQLHAGRTSEVFRGVRRRDGAAVILKALRADQGPAVVARLEREAGILRRCAGPAVPEVLGLERWGTASVLVLRDIGGESLHRLRLRRPDLDLVARAGLALELCDALAAVHAAGVVHRDLKPANIIVHGDGARVQLIDFNAASAGEGTLHYMSPEQTGRTDRAVDPRSDYYALGVTLYELFTGRLPFDSPDPLELVHAHLARLPTAPVELVPDLGDTLSRVVLRLLEKSPEARYQSLAGLRHDLARCRDALARGERPEFEPGARDRPPGLRLPAALFGRDRELALLLSSWTSAAAGARALALVSGPAGVGKSALLRELSAAVRDAGGRFAAGKFEQVEKAIPYAGLLAALDQLLRNLLAEPEERLLAARHALLDGLGDAAGALAEVLPALALVTGPTGPAPEVAPAEAAARFHAALARLLRAFARPERPLALALDDLQWADPPTLRLLDELARDPSLDHLLLVGTFRDDEVPAAHPLRALAPDLALPLGPLADADVAALVAAALAWPEDQALTLAAAIAGRTDNNPLFVRAYLRWLFDQGLLVYAPERDAWVWDAARTAAAPPGDDLVALMTRRLADLRPDARAALQAAACLGARFDPRRLAPVLACPQDQVDAALAEAEARGLIQPVAAFGPATAREFVHDKVQQAAYASLPADERLRLHLELGRDLLRRTPRAGLDDLLFEITGHLNLAAARIDDPAERLRLAELDLAAARKARRAAAFDAAVQHLRQGIAALPDDAWSTHYRLTFALHSECMECEHFAGDPEAADARFAPLLARARDDLDRAELHALKVALATDRAEIRRALDFGRAGLALLGVTIPARASRLAVARELAALRWLRGRADLRALADLPLADDPRVRLSLRLLGVTSISAYYVQSELLSLCMLRILALSLRHGAAGETSLALAIYGVIHAQILGDPAGARDLLDAAYALADRVQDPRWRTRLANYAGSFLAMWIEPLAHAVHRIQPEIERAVRLGDAATAVFIAAGVCNVRWLAGDVDAIFAAAQQAEPLCRRFASIDFSQWSLPFTRAALALRGETHAPTSLSTDDWDEAGFLAELGNHRRSVLAVYYVVKLVLLYHHGALAEAAALSERLHGARMEANPLLLDHYAYGVLRLTAAGEPLRRRDLALALRWLGHLRRWHRLHEGNVAGRLHLVEAELARCRRDPDQATLLYQRAVEAARRAGHPRIEALALERAGRHALSLGSCAIGQLYLDAARKAYERWGAPTLAARLAREFPELAPPAPRPAPPPSSDPAPSSGVEGLDVAALLRSAQAITGELVLDKLLRALVRTVMAIAGARRCFVLLADGPALRIAARGDAAGDRIELPGALDMADEPSIARAIVHFVARTRRDVVLGDVGESAEFAGDPALVGRRDVLCTPILHHGDLLGVLYLDNDLAAHTFSSARLQLLRHLAAQIATSIDNARLYDDLARARDAAVRADRLKARFLLNMSHELRTPLGAVVGYAELIQESVAERDLSAIDADAAKIRRAAARLVRTLTSILELSRLEVDLVVPAREPVDLGALVRDAARALEADARAAGDELRLDLADDLVLRADPGMLAHCVTALLDNAVRFTARGRVDVAARTLERDGARWLELRVADTGVGIAADDLPRLFVSFQPLDDSPTRARDGSGVSLAVAQRFARLLGGAIDVVSAPGHGSTFTLTLPAPAP